LALDGWDEGVFWVQDAAASIPVQLLAPQAGERVADLCAAPGGKSLQIAASGAKVVAIDASAERLDRLRENLARTGLNAEIITGDIERWTPPEPFDAVLLDAPCTATGTVRRHPEVVWIRRPEDAGTMGNVQRRMLAAAAKLLRPGGRLVYAVCSLEPEEGPGVVASASQHGLVADPIRPEEVEGLEQAITPEGALRLLPSHWADKGGLDGFFVARFVKG
jgi:16S rRNA (cytosine967-C5)-methyltransferase